MEKASVVIPTYNRFECLMNAVTSIKTQTHTNIEIIIINDCSTERKYYEYDWRSNDVIIIHLEQNTKEIFGFACAGHNRNIGIRAATGKYVGFCDDDDVWFPSKLELQINAMKETKCKMSSTDGLIGHGMYDNTKTYKKYNSEHFLKFMKNKYGCMLQGNSFPKICTPDYFHIHNYIICSSVLMEKELLSNINNFKHLPNGYEDPDCWRRAMKYTNNAYVTEPCFYYDLNHGNGKQY